VCVKPDDIGKDNHGLNPPPKPGGAQSSQLSEIAEVMQALRLMPDIEDDADLGVHTRVANQGLPVDWRLQIERLGSLVPQPSELPQFHPHISRTTSVRIEA